MYGKTYTAIIIPPEKFQLYWTWGYSVELHAQLYRCNTQIYKLQESWIFRKKEYISKRVARTNNLYSGQQEGIYCSSSACQTVEVLRIINAYIIIIDRHSKQDFLTQ